MRIRTIKPEFYRSDDITALSREHRLLFIGLWSYVDDNGVGIDDFRQISADLFALEDDQKEIRDFVREGLATLSRALLVSRYEVDGRRYIFIVKWDKHQKIDRPGKARYPRPPEGWKPPTSVDPDPRDTLATDSRDPRSVLDTGTNRTSADLGSTSDALMDVSDLGEVATCGSRDPRETLATGTGEQGNKEKISATAAAVAKPDLDAGFDEFWTVYPRRVKKEDAKKAWRQVRRKGVAAEHLIAAARVQVERWRVEGQETKFVSHPSSWLRGGSYDDEPEPVRLSLVPTHQQSADPDAALAELYSRADAKTAADLIGATWVEPAQRPSDPTPYPQWSRARRLDFLDEHREAICAALIARETG